MTIDLINQDVGNSVLFYGKESDTNFVMKQIYEKMKQNDKFLCSWHNAELIKTPIDFFDPILKSKYGEEYNSFREEEWFKKGMGELIGRNIDSSKINHQKLPLIFIEGIENLFFNMDYYLTELDRINFNPNDETLKTKYGNFGNTLRKGLFTPHNGIIYGSVKDKNSKEYNYTLGNYDYLFYVDNFMKFQLE
ncbi:MAG: hypothetical protein WC755_05050, partial [Candidatus Woesearchaeota archaeon]|jgi:hypothetical protein